MDTNLKYSFVIFLTGVINKTAILIFVSFVVLFSSSHETTFNLEENRIFILVKYIQLELKSFSIFASY
jgi:hypothetical protein